METAVGIIGGAAIGAILTLAGTYWLWVLQRHRKQLGYEVVSAHVVIPKLEKPTPDIKVMVRESLLNQDGSADEFVAVDEICGFRIRVRNTGNQVVEDQLVTFSMDKRAKVISVEAEEYPDLGGRSVVSGVSHPTSNVATARIPFLNPAQEILFSLQSVDNECMECGVTAGAPGLTYFDMERRRIVWTACLTLVATMGFTIPPGVLKLLEIAGTISISHIQAVDSYVLVSLMASWFVPLYVSMLFVRSFRRRWYAYARRLSPLNRRLGVISANRRAEKPSATETRRHG
jgi:hypothetical protein